jgi:hypothetical protein
MRSGVPIRSVKMEMVNDLHSELQMVTSTRSRTTSSEVIKPMWVIIVLKSVVVMRVKAMVTSHSANKIEKLVATFMITLVLRVTETVRIDVTIAVNSLPFVIIKETLVHPFRTSEPFINASQSLVSTGSVIRTIANETVAAIASNEYTINAIEISMKNDALSFMADDFEAHVGGCVNTSREGIMSERPTNTRMLIE